MPSQLDNSSIDTEVDEVAHFLRDCGLANNMQYSTLLGNDFSWTTMDNIESAFKDDFNYLSVKKHIKNNWGYGSAWNDLIRSEIDASRPVLYRGDENDLIGGDKHYFVIDGYDESNPDYFWINFGWGNSPYNFVVHYLGDITSIQPNYNFNQNQRAICGISPTYTEPSNINIFDLPYTYVSDVKIEEAQQDIFLPAMGKELIIDTGGDLSLTAGNSITLNTGFEAIPGSIFTAKIVPALQQEMDISVPEWYDVITPNDDGYNDQLCIDVENANSWEFEAIDEYNIPIFQSAGTIEDNTVCLWDGTNATCQNAYRCIIRFKNNFGRALEHDYMVSVICESVSEITNDFNISKEKIVKSSIPIINQKNDQLYFVYPNPSAGLFNIKFENSDMVNLKIYNWTGNLCQELNNITQSDIVVNLSQFPSGIYLISLEINNQICTHKIILSK